MTESIFFIILIIVIIIFATAAWAGLLAAPWIPTRKKDIERCLNFFDVKKDEVIYELGSGDARLVIALAEKFEANVTGLEISFILFVLSWLKLKLKKLPCAKILYKDFYKFNLSKADYIFCFLTPKAMEKLKPKFKKELRTGAKVVSLVFKIKGWKPLIISRPLPDDVPIYIYKI